MKTLLHYCAKNKSLKSWIWFHQFLMTKLCQTFMITSWIVYWLEKHILRIWNIASLLQWLLTRLEYCPSSKCPPLARTWARRHALLLFPTVKEFLKSVNSWWSYCKNLTSCYFLRHWVSKSLYTWRIITKVARNAFKSRLNCTSHCSVFAVWREDCSILSVPPPKNSCLRAKCKFSVQWEQLINWDILIVSVD